MKLLYLVVFIVSWLAMPNITAQKQIKGKVLSPESHEGHDHEQGEHEGEVVYEILPGATVIWKGTTVGTMTDLFGFFKIPAFNIGDTLQVSMIGYETVWIVYTGWDYLDIPLQSGVLLNEAEIEARRSTTSISLLDPLNIQQLNRKELAKAACCNLSEAFETNASVDASFTDAVTGTRQIRMLGLDGKYTQLLVDNLPGPRGLNVVQGLSFIPGPWIDNISISKGTGSVLNGYESITGQINVAMRNPENAEPLHINLYISGDGRLEWNHVSSHQVSRRWSTALLTHAELGVAINDRNYDTFLDTPLKRDIVLRNEWKFRGDRGIRGEYTISSVIMDRLAGQKSAYSDSNSPFDLLETYLDDTLTDNINWTAATTISRLEASAKTGYVFPGQSWKSIGSQFFASTHKQEHKFGNRSYMGTENYFRGNVLFSSIINNTDHKFTTGLSFVYDDFNEIGTWGAEYDEWNSEKDTVARTEIVPGAFLEYTWTAGERLVVVAGLRGDHLNLDSRTYVSPRLHVRYSLAEETSIKFVAGRGFRTANVFMEQLGSWASNRRWDIQEDLDPEVATNLGVNLVSKFRLNSRDASLSLDGYYTNFDNRIIVDLYNSPHEVSIYNLNNVGGYQSRSSSKTVQIEFDWSFHRRLDVRAAYRWVDAVTGYASGDYDAGYGFEMQQDPYVSKHRAFTQWSYASKETLEGKQTRIDATVQWVGPQALPVPGGMASMHPSVSPAFTQVNLQFTQMLPGNLELYVGVENITNVKQMSPIAGFNDGVLDLENFDASLVYGPIMGRMSYAGLRWTLGG
ncbi:MAG: TonB-dependent receptor [Flavobacteriales bacterium]|nr:TonB-dependent receptor [Flavobacteriales bacterium]